MHGPGSASGPSGPRGTSLPGRAGEAASTDADGSLGVHGPAHAGNANDPNNPLGQSSSAGPSDPHDPGGPGEPGGPNAPSGPNGPDDGGWSHSGGDEPSKPPAPDRPRRDQQHKILGGVCSGLGRHCDMDPVIFRIGLSVLAITGGLGLIFYGFAWLVLPADGDDEPEGRKLLTGRVTGAGLTALLLALVGCGLFLSMLNNGGVLTFAAVLGLLLAGAGYWSQHRDTTAPDPVTSQTVADAPPEAKPPPAATAPSWWRDRIVKDGTHDGATGYFWGPPELRGVDVRMDSEAWVPRADGTIPAHDHPRPAPTPKERGPRWLGGWVFLAALIAGGLGTGLSWGEHGGSASLSTSLELGLACALAVFGLGIAVSAFLGRTGVGSIVLAVLTAGLLTGAAALPENISTTWVRQEWRPTTVAEVQRQYELGSGVGTLDLGSVDLGKDRTLTTGAEVGAGRIKIVVPEDATVRLDAQVGVGDIRLPSTRGNDVDIAPGQERTTTLEPPGGSKDGGTIELRVEVGIGQVEVDRAAS
ncbi:PspC domain-containing protein [Streptomyces sp. NPDC002851]